MTLLNRKRYISVILESTYGETPSTTARGNSAQGNSARCTTVRGTSAQILPVTELTLTPIAGDRIERNLITGKLGSQPTTLGNSRAEVSFSVELAGAGTAGDEPLYAPLLAACGIEGSGDDADNPTKVTYAPVDSGFKSVSLVINQDGVKQTLAGCRGNVSVGLEAGNNPAMQFSFTGRYVPPVAEAFSDIDISEFTKPLVVSNANTAATVAGQSVVTRAISLDLGNNVAPRDLINFSSIEITDRQANGNFDIEALAADVDPKLIELAASAGVIALEVTHGTTAGNIVKLSIPNAEVRDPSYGEADGVITIQTSYGALRTNRDNEFNLEVK